MNEVGTKDKAGSLASDRSVEVSLSLRAARLSADGIGSTRGPIPRVSTVEPACSPPRFLISKRFTAC